MEFVTSIVCIVSIFVISFYSIFNPKDVKNIEDQERDKLDKIIMKILLFIVTLFVFVLIIYVGYKTSWLYNNMNEYKQIIKYSVLLLLVFSIVTCACAWDIFSRIESTEELNCGSGRETFMTFTIVFIILFFKFIDYA